MAEVFVIRVIVLNATTCSCCIFIKLKCFCVGMVVYCLVISFVSDDYVSGRRKDKCVKMASN